MQRAQAIDHRRTKICREQQRLFFQKPARLFELQQQIGVAGTYPQVAGIRLAGSAQIRRQFLQRGARRFERRADPGGNTIGEADVQLVEQGIQHVQQAARRLPALHDEPSQVAELRELCRQSLQHQGMITRPVLKREFGHEFIEGE
ncbi:hypothetical protein [Caballeronia sp. LZ034LL]|uniref:hypothetical protein n=1 Tax=Caballeronia sp. LZ034LL TaxID=3038567 RepID=UPI00286BAC7D|nr:hypothetical protein [Caballeronia sp. LZ034LL]